MWWECSECGEMVERARPPAVCRACGTAGAVFVEAESGLELAPGVEDLRTAWVLAGLDLEPAAAA